jgi:hypothetical protein
MKAKRDSFKARHSANIAKGPSSAAYWANKVKWADGGSVRTHYAEGDSVKASPQQPVLGYIADFLKQSYAPQRTQQMQGTMEFLGVPALARTVERVSYGQPITNINKANVPLLQDDTAEAAMLVGPMAGPLGRAGKAGARVVGEELNRAILDNSGALARMVPQAAKPMYVVKPKGGNWLSGSIESAVDPLLTKGMINNREIPYGPDFDVAIRKRIEDLQQAASQPNYSGGAGRVAEHLTRELENPRSNEVALNKWIEQKLGKYVKNDMGTPEDPVRALAEQGVLHVNPGQLNYRLEAHGKYPQSGQEFLAKSDTAKMWEGASDNVLGSSPAGDWLKFSGDSAYAKGLEDNPWLRKVPPETTVYRVDEANRFADNLGFNHLIDELKNAIDPNSTLPANLRLKYTDLDKVTMPQAVERVSKINDWRMAQAAEAEKAGMMENLTAAPRLEDTTAQLSFVEKPGMTWVDIPATTDEKANKLCTTIGKQAGWCTQGSDTAKFYGSGNNRLTTLLDSEGRPHVQAMLTENARLDPISDKFKELDQPVIDSIRAAAQSADPRGVDWGPQGKFVTGEEADLRRDLIRAETLKRFPEWAELKVPVDVTELKPVGNTFSSNRAREYVKRDPQYQTKITDSVVKFLNAGEWGKVNDLDKYDIVDLQNSNSVKQMLRDVTDYDLPHERMDKFTAATHFNPDASRFMSRSQFREFIEPPPAPAPVKEQKMLQGFYRGYAGDYDATKAGTDSGMVFVSPQRGVGDIFANKRAAQTGADPHLEMIMADPFAGYGYGMNVPLNKQNQKIDFTKARQLDPKDVKSRTQLYAEGGSVSAYDPMQIDEIMNSFDTPQNYAEGGDVHGPDMEFNEDPGMLRLYKHAMSQLTPGKEEKASSVGVGVSSKIGGGDFSTGFDMNRVTQGQQDQMMKALAANYNVNVGGVNLNARVQKPLEAKDVLVGMLNGSIPLGEGRAMLGIQGVKTPYGSEVLGYNAGYMGNVGPGRLSVNVNKPKQGSPSGQVQYQVPFAEGGSVTAYDPDQIDAIANQYM